MRSGAFDDAYFDRILSFTDMPTTVAVVNATLMLQRVKTRMSGYAVLAVDNLNFWTDVLNAIGAEETVMEQTLLGGMGARLSTLLAERGLLNELKGL